MYYLVFSVFLRLIWRNVIIWEISNLSCCCYNSTLWAFLSWSTVSFGIYENLHVVHFSLIVLNSWEVCVTWAQEITQLLNQCKCRHRKLTRVLNAHLTHCWRSYILHLNIECYILTHALSCSPYLVTMKYFFRFIHVYTVYGRIYFVSNWFRNMLYVIYVDTSKSLSIFLNQVPQSCVKIRYNLRILFCNFASLSTKK